MNKKLLAVVAVAMCVMPAMYVMGGMTDDASAVDSSYSVNVIPGDPFAYTPSANISNPTYSISGNATSWLSMDSSTNRISGTAPMSISSSNDTLTITASTTRPTQTATQTVKFTALANVGFQLGPNVTGTLSTSTWHLAVTGTGAMYDWSSQGSTPLKDYLTRIKSVNIDSGVTTIGAYCFSWADDNTALSADYIHGMAGVTEIKEGAFAGCAVSSFPWTYMRSLTAIGDYAFQTGSFADENGESGQVGIILLDNVATIGTGAFAQCDWNLLAVGSGLTTVGTGAFTTNNNAAISFVEHDGTTAISGAAIKSSVFTRTDASSGAVATNALYCTARNAAYGGAETYMVAGASVPVSAADNITLTAAWDSAGFGNDYLDETVDTFAFTLRTAVGTATLGVTGSAATFVGGNAPSATGTIQTGFTAIGTQTTASTPDHLTLVWDFGGDFAAVVVAPLAFTSEPPSVATA